MSHDYNQSYTGENLSRIAFPLGGIGAGMFCIEGTGALSHFSLRHAPDVFNEPKMMAAIAIRGDSPVGRVLEGPVPMWKAYGMPGAANGQGGKTWGLPRMQEARFGSRFPFAEVDLEDPALPIAARITAWSPFTPPEPDDSSLPAAGLEYEFRNDSDAPVSAVFSFHSDNFMRTQTPGNRVMDIASGRGFMLFQPLGDEAPADEGAFQVEVLDAGEEVQVDLAWFRGGWFDPLTMAWKTVSEGKTRAAGPHSEGQPGSGASLYVPIELGPGESRTVRLAFTWYVPVSGLRTGRDPEGCCSDDSCCCSDEDKQPDTFRPWYSSRFNGIDQVSEYFRDNYDSLKQRSAGFTEAFYSSTLPPEVVEAVAANLSILKSPTVLRQHDGKLWSWEGCWDSSGCCEGSCTHVWNYAQAIGHLFPSLERSLRETEFGASQDERGHQAFRSALPIRPLTHDFHAAADGQLGGIIKAYRDWRICGDDGWIADLWPALVSSLDYCIATWDPRGTGTLEEPHHNTYDVEFWGPDGMCTSFYLGALASISEIGEHIGEDVSRYRELLAKGRKTMESELFDGEYFFQRVRWDDLNAKPPLDDPNYSQEARDLLKTEGPKYQYGTGCLSDGVLGCWMGLAAGIPEFVDRSKVVSSLGSIFRYNYRSSLAAHANAQRPTYAFGQEAGLLLCSWPKGGKLSLPFPYSDEVWTGIEYQAASHMMMLGLAEEGLQIVRSARDRYDGRFRNPYNEYECGHWYARAMASYALLQGLTGIRFDAVSRVLHIEPRVAGDFTSFLSTATGYGAAGVRDGEPFLEVASGEIPAESIAYRPYGS